MLPPHPEADEQTGQQLHQKPQHIFLPLLWLTVESIGSCAKVATVRKMLMIRRTLQQRCEQLMLLLADQVQNLPIGNESWQDTERELQAVEQALAQLPLADG